MEQMRKYLQISPSSRNNITVSVTHNWPIHPDTTIRNSGKIIQLCISRNYICNKVQNYIYFTLTPTSSRSEIIEKFSPILRHIMPISFVKVFFNEQKGRLTDIANSLNFPSISVLFDVLLLLLFPFFLSFTFHFDEQRGKIFHPCPECFHFDSHQLFRFLPRKEYEFANSIHFQFSKM